MALLHERYRIRKSIPRIGRDETAEQVRDRHRGIDVDGLAETSVGFVETPVDANCSAEVRIDDGRQGIQFRGSLRMAERFLAAAQNAQHVAEPLVGGGIVGIELIARRYIGFCALVLASSAGVISADDAHASARFGSSSDAVPAARAASSRLASSGAPLYCGCKTSVSASPTYASANAGSRSIASRKNFSASASPALVRLAMRCLPSW